MTLLTWLSFFAHSGSTCLKAARRTLMKLSHSLSLLSTILFVFSKNIPIVFWRYSCYPKVDICCLSFSRKFEIRKATQLLPLDCLLEFCLAMNINTDFSARRHGVLKTFEFEMKTLFSYYHFNTTYLKKGWVSIETSSAADLVNYCSSFSFMVSNHV
jgi:hypothetical protein